MSDETTADEASAADDAAAEGELLAELRVLAAATDPVPPATVAAARSAIAWRTLDAELAELTADASVGPQLAGARGGGASALLTFEAPGASLEVEVTEDGLTRRFLGQLVPPGRGAVVIRHRGGRMAVAADEVGRFTATGVAPGPVSIRCRLDETVVETDWFLI